MARVFIPTQLRELSGGAGEVELAGATVRQIVSALEQRFPGMAARLMRDEELSPSLQVSVDGVMSTRGLMTAVGPGSEVHFLPAIGGG
jgi:molybdopterin synthase sulfur carrier subunit